MFCWSRCHTMRQLSNYSVSDSFTTSIAELLKQKKLLTFNLDCYFPAGCLQWLCTNSGMVIQIHVLVVREFSTVTYMLPQWTVKHSHRVRHKNPTVLKSDLSCSSAGSGMEVWGSFEESTRTPSTTTELRVILHPPCRNPYLLDICEFLLT